MKYRKGMTWYDYADYIILNYQNCKLYDLKEDGTFEEIGYLKKYGMNEDRSVLRDIEERNNNPFYNNPPYIYSEHIVPVKNWDTPKETLYDQFFPYGKSKEEGEDYRYSYPNEFWPVEDLDILYPHFYNEVSVDERWWSWNENIYDSIYGCYYFNGS